MVFGFGTSKKEQLFNKYKVIWDELFAKIQEFPYYSPMKSEANTKIVDQYFSLLERWVKGKRLNTEEIKNLEKALMPEGNILIKSILSENVLHLTEVSSGREEDLRPGQVEVKRALEEADYLGQRSLVNDINQLIERLKQVLSELYAIYVKERVSR